MNIDPRILPFVPLIMALLRAQRLKQSSAQNQRTVDPLTESFDNTISAPERSINNHLDHSISSVLAQIQSKSQSIEDMLSSGANELNAKLAPLVENLQLDSTQPLSLAQLQDSLSVLQDDGTRQLVDLESLLQSISTIDQQLTTIESNLGTR
jgi:hypothetical protein